MIYMYHIGLWQSEWWSSTLIKGVDGLSLKSLFKDYGKSYSINLLYKDFNSRSNNLDLLDPGPKIRMKTYGDHSFRVAGVEEWNKLPLDLKKSPCLLFHLFLFFNLDKKIISKCFVAL